MDCRRPSSRNLAECQPRQEKKSTKDWCESVIGPIYNKGDRSSCESRRGISLANILYKSLAGVILRRLSSTRKRCMPENQDGFRPGRGCIHQIPLCDKYEIDTCSVDPRFLPLRCSYQDMRRKANV